MAATASRKQTWEAIWRLEQAGKVFRFRVDNEFFMGLTSHREGAHALIPFPMSEEWRVRYAGIGVHPPAEIRRDATEVVAWDDEEFSYDNIIRCLAFSRR